jgi:hypothetical protein
MRIFRLKLHLPDIQIGIVIMIVPVFIPIHMS